MFENKVIKNYLFKLQNPYSIFNWIVTWKRNETVANAAGFLKAMQTFETIFYLKTLIIVFDRVKQSLCDIDK